jgi:hypothetical protein
MPVQAVKQEQGRGWAQNDGSVASERS